MVANVVSSLVPALLHGVGDVLSLDHDGEGLDEDLDGQKGEVDSVQEDEVVELALLPGGEHGEAEENTHDL